jgi:hypothetical protein
MPATPLPWQSDPIRVVANAIRNRRSVLDASDTGTGKTFVTLFAAKAAGMRVAVICPKSVIAQWEEAAALVGVPTLFVKNVEALRWEKPPRFLRKAGRSWQWRLPADTLLVFDEVHRFAGADTDNGAILNSAPRPVAMLSRTAADSPLRLRAIASQLGLCSWHDWKHWIAKYGCVAGDLGGYVFTGGVPDDEFRRLPDFRKAELTRPHLEAMHRQVFGAGRGVRVRVADLEPGIFPENLVDTVAVPVESQKALDEAFAAEIEARRRDAVGVLPEMMHARQLAEHLKLPAMIELGMDALADGKTVVVFVNFRDSLSRLVDAFDAAGFAAVSIHGDQTSEEREYSRQLVQTDRIRVAAVMTQAGGVGLSLHDLTGRFPRYGLHSPGWSATNLIQSLGRLPRAGAKSNVIQRVVFAAGTIEERVRVSVQRKAHAIDTLNDGDLRL